MKTTALAALTAFTLTSGAAMAETRTYDFEPFTRIDIASGLDAVVERGDAQSVRLEAGNAALIDRVDISVSHGKLSARLDTNLLDIILNGGLLNMFNGGHGVTLYITVPTLEGVEGSSGATIEAAFLSGDHPRVGASSGANVSVAGAEARLIDLSASSGAKLALAGSCDRLVLDFSSGARIAAADLACLDVEVSGSSGASADVTATGTVTGSISSGAHVGLRGKPGSVRVDTSSGAGVTVN